MTVKEFYEQIGGTYEEALARLMNDILILKFLKKFYNEYKLDALNQAYENKNARQIFEAAHAIKGVVGNLSLTKLFNLSSSITEKVRNVEALDGIDLKDDISAINTEFNKVIDLIGQL